MACPQAVYKQRCQDIPAAHVQFLLIWRGPQLSVSFPVIPQQQQCCRPDNGWASLCMSTIRMEGRVWVEVKHAGCSADSPRKGQPLTMGALQSTKIKLCYIFTFEKKTASLKWPCLPENQVCDWTCICSSLKKLQWIPTKILHCYYRDSADDRLCVERCLLSCIVPDSLPDPQRMERMAHVYYSMEDEHAVRYVLVCRHALGEI